PQMAWISQNNFPALKQERMIVGRGDSEASLNGQRPNRRADCIESRAINQSKARMPRSPAAQQRDKPGSEECDAGNDSFWKRPAPNQIAPQKRENEKVPPTHQFEIVPIPWRGLNEVPNREDHNRRQHKCDVRRRFRTPTPTGFPSAPATKRYQCQGKHDP